MTDITYTNPFINSRVDTPFQHHPDLKSIYGEEFKILRSAIGDIKKDPNSQSMAVTITGPPGAGKTHLAMRLADEILASNRLLFIRQPNNIDSVYHHIYTRILESLVEKIPNSPYSQLEHLLGKSFSAILIKIISDKEVLSVKDRTILDLLISDPMNIYKKIGGPGTEARRRNWKYIEAKTMEWWESSYGLAGHGHDILKAFIKYCSYTDPRRKQIIFRWLNGSAISEDEAKLASLSSDNSEINKEEFSLDAMMVIARLSLADEPLVIVFDQLEGLKYNEDLLFRFFEVIKELFTHLQNTLFIFNLFTDRWASWKKILNPSIVDRLSNIVLKLTPPPPETKIQLLEMRAQEAGIPLMDFFSDEEIRSIIANSSIRAMLISASNHFRHKMNGTPLAVTAMSHEEKVEAELKDLRQEIDALKRYLNMTVPTFKEVMEATELKSFFEAQEKELKKEKAQAPVYSETDDCGKMFLISGLFKGGSINDTGRLKLKGKKLPDHLLIHGKDKKVVTGFLHMRGNALTSRLKNINTLCDSHPDMEFFILRDATASKIKSKVAKQVAEELKKKPNFNFIKISNGDRIKFEIIYQMIVAIQNRDLEGEPLSALRIAKTIYSPHFIFDILGKAGVFI